MGVMQQHGRSTGGGGGGDDGPAPAEISQAEWDRYKGYVIRTGSMVDTLRSDLKTTNAQLELVRIEMKSTRVALAEFKKSVSDRLDKNSDWRETTGRHDLEALQKQVEKYEQKEERRMALWLKLALGVAAAIAEAGVLHWLKW